jgi:hypothetical protein
MSEAFKHDILTALSLVESAVMRALLAVAHMAIFTPYATEETNP